jgi:polyisoprenoid-binding protein YceI
MRAVALYHKILFTKTLNTMNATTEVKTKWSIDTTHTEVLFKVKHLVISTVTGSFKKFSGEVISEAEDFDNANAAFSIDVNSIDTNQSDRDAHLKSEDFFAAAQYPSLTFSNGTLKKVKGNEYTLTGDLTIRNVTKRVELDVEFGGTTVDPWGNTKAGFEINGKINRKEFGLSWNALTEAGGMVVSEEVKLHLNVELAKG